MGLGQRRPWDNSTEEHLNRNGDQEQTGKPDGWRWAEPWKHCSRKFLIILLVVAAVIITVVLFALILHFAPAASPAGPWCQDGWIGYQGRCYYFSEAEATWDTGQSNCSSFGANLAVINTAQEKVRCPQTTERPGCRQAFLLRYKGLSEHWIGLWREEGQPWRWVDGTEFNTLFEVRADGHCAYLNDDAVGSSWCHTRRNWICTYPDAYAKG
ncbi:C-type lectin domain family 2 member B-like isoform X1 [Pelodiscus sinensis]|uniref:C-type lectin domain family 2 member B-like isoform X1 n=1 Tax=Pelodiscus sinensis TaxID=13735 RepID=UPI003F6D4E8B